MAADTQMNDYGMISYTDKIFRIRDMLVGVAGEISSCLKAIRYMEEGEESKIIELDGDISLLILKERQIYTCDKTLELIPIHLPFYAIGSGKEAAMGALYAGASLEEALEIACKIDPDTGGKVELMSLIFPIKV